MLRVGVLAFGEEVLWSTQIGSGVHPELVSHVVALYNCWVSSSVGRGKVLGKRILKFIQFIKNDLKIIECLFCARHCSRLVVLSVHHNNPEHQLTDRWVILPEFVSHWFVVGPGILHVWRIPRWCWCGLSTDHALRTTVQSKETTSVLCTECFAQSRNFIGVYWLVV